MAANATTRRGNGPGHGPAKGGGNKPAEPFAADTPTRVLASDTNDWDEAQAFRQQRQRDKWADIKAAREARKALVAAPEHPAHWNAVKDTLDREEGPITQKSVVTGEDGAPLLQAIQVTFVKPKP